MNTVETVAIKGIDMNKLRELLPLFLGFLIGQVIGAAIALTLFPWLVQ